MSSLDAKGSISITTGGTTTNIIERQAGIQARFEFTWASWLVSHPVAYIPSGGDQSGVTIEVRGAGQSSDCPLRFPEFRAGGGAKVRGPALIYNPFATFDPLSPTAHRHPNMSIIKPGLGEALLRPFTPSRPSSGASQSPIQGQGQLEKIAGVHSAVLTILEVQFNPRLYRISA